MEATSAVLMVVYGYAIIADDSRIYTMMNDIRYMLHHGMTLRHQLRFATSSLLSVP